MVLRLGTLHLGGNGTSTPVTVIVDTLSDPGSQIQTWFANSPTISTGLVTLNKMVVHQYYYEQTVEYVIEESNAGFNFPMTVTITSTMTMTVTSSLATAHPTLQESNGGSAFASTREEPSVSAGIRPGSEPSTTTFGGYVVPSSSDFASNLGSSSAAQSSLASSNGGSAMLGPNGTTPKGITSTGLTLTNSGFSGNEPYSKYATPSGSTIKPNIGSSFGIQSSLTMSNGGSAVSSPSETSFGGFGPSGSTINPNIGSSFGVQSSLTLSNGGSAISSPFATSSEGFGGSDLTLTNSGISGSEPYSNIASTASSTELFNPSSPSQSSDSITTLPATGNDFSSSGAQEPALPPTFSGSASYTDSSSNAASPSTTPATSPIVSAKQTFQLYISNNVSGLDTLAVGERTGQLVVGGVVNATVLHINDATNMTDMTGNYVYFIPNTASSRIRKRQDSDPTLDYCQDPPSNAVTSGFLLQDITLSSNSSSGNYTFYTCSKSPDAQPIYVAEIGQTPGSCYNFDLVTTPPPLNSTNVTSSSNSAAASSSSSRSVAAASSNGLTVSVSSSLAAALSSSLSFASTNTQETATSSDLATTLSDSSAPSSYSSTAATSSANLPAESSNNGADASSNSAATKPVSHAFSAASTSSVGARSSESLNATTPTNLPGTPSSSAVAAADSSLPTGMSNDAASTTSNGSVAAISSSVTPTSTASPSVVQDTGNFVNQGLYDDPSSAQILNGDSKSSLAMTVDACASYCQNYVYFGVENGGYPLAFLR